MSARMSRMSQRARAAANSAWSSGSNSTLGVGGESPNRGKQILAPDRRSSESSETAEEAVARKFPTLSFEPASTLSLNSNKSSEDTVNITGYTNPFDETKEKVTEVEKTEKTNIEVNTQNFMHSRTSAPNFSVRDQNENENEDEDEVEDEESLPPSTTSGTSSVFPLTEDALAQERIMSELGTGRSASWRIPIYGDFEQLKEGGGVNRTAFLEFMVGRGIESEWSAAAFTAFDSRKSGCLDQFQFLLAVSALTYNRGSAEMSANPRWSAMRRLLVYNLLVRGDEISDGGSGGEGVTYNSFANFLQVLSESEELPGYFGIDNKSWSRLAVEGGARQDSGSSCYSGDSDYTERAKMRTTLDIMDQSTLAESLAISKVQLASKQEALEKLELSYLKLEKLHTQLKLELAEVKAEKDVA